MKLIRKFWDNILLIITLFLLAFIPLYPKLPILGISHTWVYVRAEDFLVVLFTVVLLILLLKRKATIRTPLTIPIILFWIIGGISTIYAIFFIFPYIENVFPNVAIFHYLRRIEYLSVFFIAFNAIKNKKIVPYITATLAVTLIAVVAYGLGQRYLGLPAFLTMNEEFAKGIPLRLSSMARIPSTFAGHYDLAAYLVMSIAVLGSMIFGFKKNLVKVFLLLTATSGLVLLLMTASRVSFAVYLVTIIFMLILQRKKRWIIPVIIGSIFLLNCFQGIATRFSSTITQVDLVVDARTGKAVGIAKNIDKSSKQKKVVKPIVIEETQSTGENLPKGTGYISFPEAPVQQTTTKILYKRTLIKAGTESAQITSMEGDFVVKQVLAYDVSFTTRFQGEWPRALKAFQRNMLLGSGYSSISLATDNNYLRILGETGILGFSSFLLIFLVAGIYITRILTKVNSESNKSLILGIVAASFGLGLNAILIDVFEASKVAFVFWLLLGITFGLLRLYQNKQTIDYLAELKKIILSRFSLLLYLLIITIVIFTQSLDNYFVGDDFTWLRWASDCRKIIQPDGLFKCESTLSSFVRYFINAEGFFYRPGTKIYFYFMHAVFGLNQAPYHLGSIVFHFLNAGLIFLVVLKILKNKLSAFLSSLLFIVLSGHAETIYWISSTGHLITSAFVLASLLFYILWQENKKILFLFFSLFSILMSVLFHEFGIIAPLIIIAYDLIFVRKEIPGKLLGYWYYLCYLALIPLYLWIRDNAGSHWLSGDYNYKLINLPFNFFGNLVGYLGLSLVGSRAMPFYAQARIFGRENVLFVLVALLIILFLFYGFLRMNRKKAFTFDQKSLLFAFIFFIITLLPFLGLGNIAPRYVYLPSFGVILFLVILLQKLRFKLSKANKILAWSVILVLVSLFFYYHLLELGRINLDWKKSGEIANRLLINLNYRYQVAKTTPQNPVFYFVDVPIKKGEAWVFPVGLSDALWFTFQNENLTVHIQRSLDLALDAAEGSVSARVFEFNKEDNIEEINRTKEVVPIK